MLRKLLPCSSCPSSLPLPLVEGTGSKMSPPRSGGRICGLVVAAAAEAGQRGGGGGSERGRQVLRRGVVGENGIEFPRPRRCFSSVSHLRCCFCCCCCCSGGADNARSQSLERLLLLARRRLRRRGKADDAASDASSSLALPPFLASALSRCSCSSCS